MRSPTARTLERLKKTGCNLRVVERWNQFAKRRIDLWGADILARRGSTLIAIQSTSASNHSDRVKKCLTNPEVDNWIACGVRFYVYSWGKKGSRGKRKVWTARATKIFRGLDGALHTVELAIP